MRKRTQKKVNDISPQVQSELVRPYKQPSYEMHEYYQVPPPGIDPWPGPIVPVPIPIPTFRVQTPIFSVAPGTYSSAQTVHIMCLTDGATIYYTLDNTEPTQNKTKYVTPLVLVESTTLKARAFKEGMDASNIAKGVYTRDFFTPAIWTPDPDSHWDTSYWHMYYSYPGHTGGLAVVLKPNGTWASGYRPKKLRVTHNWADVVSCGVDIRLVLRSNGGNYCDVSAHISGTEIDLVDPGTGSYYDIYSLYFDSDMPCELLEFFVTNIEFYS